ncbi:hypothetical protein [Pseudoduganella chitinolytica]|uniref:Uncharacterized protein n=1 Tax=Pseudoduganella chitinolytica TaxID=34070 RepID=A0ABY8BHS2_9BURK|nr:hypothetical protein [Pseudoduganella chitinolytica]WEF35444.1 hypothetical protein PX653_12045 [Pseudoduganella chitinolytica]
MRQDRLSAHIGITLQKLRKMETRLSRAGLPPCLASLPVWALCLIYCVTMRNKAVRIVRIEQRIRGWLGSIRELSRHEKGRTELIDMDSGMRNDIETTKRSLLALRDACLDVGTMFGSIGFRSRLLAHTQHRFMAAIDASCTTATALQLALQSHDRCALALLREMAQVGHSALASAPVDPDAATAARSAC